MNQTGGSVTSSLLVWAVIRVSSFGVGAMAGSQIRSAVQSCVRWRISSVRYNTHRLPRETGNSQRVAPAPSADLRQLLAGEPVDDATAAERGRHLDKAPVVRGPSEWARIAASRASTASAATNATTRCPSS